MDKEFINGKMVEDMKVITNMIIKMVMGNIFGKIIKNMKDIGRMINGMVMEY